jgi:hypothetical protein
MTPFTVSPAAGHTVGQPQVKQFLGFRSHRGFARRLFSLRQDDR